MLRYISFVLLFILNLNLFAQNQERTVFKDSKRTERFETGVPILSPFLIPAYTPEMGFLFSGGALISFKTKRNNPYLSHSTLPLYLGINTEGSFFVSGSLTSFWFDNFLRFYLDGWYKNMDDNYWGVGMDKGLNINKSSETTGYHNKSFRFDPSVLFLLYKNIYIGVKASFSKFTASSISALMLEDPQVLKYGTEIFSSGAGFSAMFDSRNSHSTPQSGLLLKFDGVFYGSYFGSDNDFRIFEIDYRQYQKIIREGSLLAWQYKLNLGNENIPWNELPSFGNYNDLRGYYLDQFRDQNMMFLLLEYRHKFFKSGSEEFSRHGVAFWAGGATVFSPTHSIQTPVFSMGLGYRFELQPGMNLRLDIGFGAESAGLYFGFNEAF